MNLLALPFPRFKAFGTRGALLALLLGLAPFNPSLALEPCRIEVVEKGGGWPVPLVELKTLHQVRFVSDNAGLIAFDLPELMGKETWFDVRSPGYEVPADGFGYRGVRLTPEPGKTLRFEVVRRAIARRIGRLTGAGMFAESQKLGLAADWRESGVLGQDSIQLAEHRGHLHWAYGDTTFAHYPLGVFDMSGGVTGPRPLAAFEPPLRFRLDYFRGEKGLPRALAKMPGEGPTWLSGMVSLPDATGVSRLVATYIKVRNFLEAYQSGLCVWDDTAKEYRHLRTLWTKSDTTPEKPPMPEGHPARWREPGGREWVLFGNPLPTLRCPASFEAWRDDKSWEPLKPQDSLSSMEGEEVKPHSGSVAWHAWRKRWVTVFMQLGKLGRLGEIWYAEAKAPLGPWGKAVKVLSHDNYTFYNPRAHVELAPEDSPVLLFEGTYTREFSDHAAPTPRWDYNQILYRLDLDDPALRAARMEAP